jgi:4-amino-4-deoxy-L-arabinose transferase-like glycosyltransferase
VQSFLYASPLHADQILAVCRLSNVLLGGLLVVLIGWWAFRLWGRWAAVVAIALASLEPTLVAHASLATGDVGVSLFLVLALYLLWEHAVAPSAWRLASSGIAVGLALVSKYSSITVLPMIALIVVGHVVLGDVIAGPWPGRRTAATLGDRARQGAKVLVLVLIPVLAVIPAAYFFQGFATWLSGLELLLRRGGQTAFGRYSPEGWWYYFPVAFLLKTPLGSLFLIVVGLALARAGTHSGDARRSSCSCPCCYSSA